MAGPIAHIFLALQVLAGPLKGYFNEKEFIIGTSFPDIRYMRVIKRSQTHAKKVTLDAIKAEPNSFKAGMLFHSLVDEKRERYMQRHKVYLRMPHIALPSQTLKLAEEEILRGYCMSSDYAWYFSEVLPEELTFGIAVADIMRWHTFLQSYFASHKSLENVAVDFFTLSRPDIWFPKRWWFRYTYAREIASVAHALISKEKFDTIKKDILEFYFNFMHYI